MRPKPAHLTEENAARFQHPRVADFYPLRQPYPLETFDILLGLIADEPRTILDIGAGTGDIARKLAPHVQHVDAVDISAAMIEKGKSQPQGDLPNLRWLEGKAEEIELDPPYALITAGESLHWMDWEQLLPRLQQVSTPHAVLAIVERAEVPIPWHDDLLRLIQQHSTMQNYQPFDLTEELEHRRLFQKLGEQNTTPIVVTPLIDDYIAAFHSMSGLALTHMSPASAAAFDMNLHALVEPWSKNNTIELQVFSHVVWGKPCTQM